MIKFIELINELIAIAKRQRLMSKISYVTQAKNIAMKNQDTRLEISSAAIPRISD